VSPDVVNQSIGAISLLNNEGNRSKSNQYFAAKKAVERADSTTGAVSDLIRVMSENIASSQDT
jgi:hypothetical protein